ncbi:MAG: ABC transporter substrate-binding protein [Alphaproteobacteria bacterium]
MNMTLKSVALAAAFAVAAAMPMASPAGAGTPKNMLIMAKNIDDLITLDPAEVFEFTGGEVIANVYDRVMMFEPEDLTTLVGGVTESHTISDDGKTIVFKIRAGQTFHSGNPVTAADVAFSLRRVVKLKKTPSFILTQFGWNKDNVDGLIKTVDAMRVSVTMAADFSPGLLLNALSAGVGSVVDMKEVMKHAKDGDFGYGWLKNHSAGSGAYSLQTWNANEIVSLSAHAGYRHGAPAMKRIVLRHVPEPAAQRLMVEKGDADMARDLTPDQIRGMVGNADITIGDYPKAALIYMATNNAHPILGKDKVRQAIRYVVDYKGMADSFLAGQYKIHQAFWPSGLWGSLEETPFKMDLAKAKALLTEAGHGDGFEIVIDTLKKSPYPEIAQSVQAALAKIGVKSQIILSEGKTLWPKYRARKHQLIVAQWSPDYVDPHSNADAFAHNPDNRMEAKLTGKLAWRTSWENAEINAMTESAAKELDLVKREKLYKDLQRKVQMDGPFTVMFQKSEQVASRKNVKNFVSGANFDLVFYRTITK